jgi:hypothetical protein
MVQQKEPHQGAWGISLSNVDLGWSFGCISIMEFASFQFFDGNTFNPKDDGQRHTNKQKPGRHCLGLRTEELRSSVVKTGQAESASSPSIGAVLHRATEG